MKTISKKYLTLFMLIALVLFNACKKEDDSPNSNNNSNNTTANIVLDFFKDNLNDAKQLTSINISSGAYVWGSDYGTQIYISDCSFLDSEGNPVTGIIEFELIEAQTKLDMLKLNRPTFTNDGQLLVSGGILYVNATQDGEDLIINPDCGLQVNNMPNTTNNGFNGSMQYFSGNVDGDGVFRWDLEEEDTLTVQTWQDSGWTGLGFGFEIDSIGWINCDYFYNTGDSLTEVQVELPNGYDGNNTQVFIYYNSINSLAGLYDTDQDGVFDLGAGYETPVGMLVKFIAISGDSVNGYNHHITSDTPVTMSHYETIPNMSGPITHSALEAILNAL